MMTNIKIKRVIDKLILNPYSNGNNCTTRMLNELISEPALITFINLHSLHLIERETEIIDKLDFMFIDGILLKWFLEKSKSIKLIRVSFDMTSLAKHLFDFASKLKKTIYIIGGTKNDIEIATENILAEYQDLDIVGFHSGYFKNKTEEKNTILEIVSKSPQIIIAGMGTPQQEHFLISLKKEGWNGLGFTCGAFIKQTAKSLNYYPKVFDKFHLRWLYRIFDEPKLFGRYFFEYPKMLRELILFKLRYDKDPD